MKLSDEEINSELQTHKEAVKEALKIEESEITPATELLEKIRKKLKPNSVVKHYGVTIQAPDGAYLKFDTTLESDVIENAESTGAVLMDLAVKMTDEDIQRIMHQKYSKEG